MTLIATLKAALLFLAAIVMLMFGIIIIEIAILLGMETWDRHKRNKDPWNSGE